MKGEVLVQMKSGLQLSSLSAAATKIGARLERTYAAKSEGSVSFAVYSSTTLSSDSVGCEVEERAGCGGGLAQLQARHRRGAK